MASVAAPLGLLLAWAGLFLPWRSWSAEAGDGSSSGFHEATAFWLVLAIVTVLLLVARFARYSVRDRERRWVHGAVAVGALALIGLAVRESAGYRAEASVLVSVGPGIGALLSLLGALILLAGELAGLALRRKALTWALAATVLVIGVAAIWPAADGRPADGAIAEIADAQTRALAFHGDELYGANETYLTALPGAGRDYDAFTIRKAGWFSSIADGSADDVAFAGDALYARLGNLDRVGTLSPFGVSVLRDDRVTEVAEMDLDDPLTLDTGACTAVHALAADDDGNLYLALRSVAMVVGVTPTGHMAVVAGTGPVGWSDGDGHAVQAHLGQVNGVAVGPDGDLYIDEDNPISRVRRIADPASLLDDPPPKPAAPVTTGVCGAIARVRDVALSNSGPTELESALAALGRAAPDEIRGRVDELIHDYQRHLDDDKRLTEVIWYHDGYRTTVADYAENECGLSAGYDLSVDDVNRFCLASRRYLDTHESWPRTGTEPPPEWAAVQDAAPRSLEFANSGVVDDFASSICVNN